VARTYARHSFGSEKSVGNFNECLSVIVHLSGAFQSLVAPPLLIQQRRSLIEAFLEILFRVPHCLDSVFEK